MAATCGVETRMYRFDGKNVLVTGASSGLGKAVANHGRLDAAFNNAGLVILDSSRTFQTERSVC